MKHLYLLLCFFSVLPAMAASQQHTIVKKFNAKAPLQKILFGSCSNQDKPMPIFDAINKEQSDLFIFLGDNIYGDTKNMQVLADKYQRLGKNKGFAQLRKTTPLIAIWDDHDLGENDAGAQYPEKEASRKLMLDFWDTPKDSPRYTQKHGLYTSYMYGNDAQKVHVIMPDLRWNRTPLLSVSKQQYKNQRSPKNEGPYIANHAKNASLLGEVQWQWLEKELQKPAKITVIASSIQLLPEFTGWESWANFPNDRQRLFDLINKYQVNGVIIISGDSHWGEMSQVKDAVAYPLWEVTSSGLTEEWKKVSPNIHRVGQYIDHINYGEISIDWQATDPLITLSLKDQQGTLFSQQKIKLSTLQGY